MQVYKGTKRARPAVAGTKPPDATTEQVKQILRRLPDPDHNDNEVCFWLDNTASSFAYMTVYTIIGNGFKVRVPGRPRSEKKIKNFNKRINVNGDTIIDYVVDVWLDNLIYGYSLYRITRDIEGLDNETLSSVDIQRIPPHTITIKRDPYNGWRKFIQRVPGSTEYKSPNDFLKSKYKPYSPKEEIVIPDDQTAVIYVSLFRKPPMSTVVPYVVLKYWILTFIRRFSEKLWAPYFLGYVGDPKTSRYPNDELEMEDALHGTVSALNKLRNFGSAAFPGDTRVEMKEPGNKGSIYLEYLNAMDKEIMLGLFSSIAVRGNSGVYKGNQIADESTVAFLRGVRLKIESALKRFYVMNVTPELSEDDIVFVWPELRTSSLDTINTAIRDLATYGVFKDARERRRAAAQIFPFLMEEDLTDEELEKMERDFIDLNKPSQPKDQAMKNGSKAERDVD